MSAPPKIRDWWHQVRSELLPETHGHQVNALAELSFAMVMAEHCRAVGRDPAVTPQPAAVVEHASWLLEQRLRNRERPVRVARQ